MRSPDLAHRPAHPRRTSEPEAIQPTSRRRRRTCVCSSNDPAGKAARRPRPPQDAVPGRRRGEGSFVTDIIDSAVDSSQSAGGSTRGGAISTLRLPELQALASELGVTGTSKMRKSDLVDAIKEKRGGGRAGAGTAKRASTTAVAPGQRPARDAER